MINDLFNSAEGPARRLKLAAAVAAERLRVARQRAMKSLIDSLRAAAKAFLNATDSPERESEKKEAKAPRVLPSHAEMAKIVVNLAEARSFVTASEAVYAIPGLSKVEARALFAKLCDEGVVQWADSANLKGCISRKPAASKTSTKKPEASKAPSAVSVKPPSPSAPIRMKPVPKVTAHALERWALHHDNVTAEAVSAAWTHGLVLDNGVVSEVTGEVRRVTEPNNEYRMTPDYRGILVGVREFSAISIRTYLRMHSAQEAWLREHYPDAFNPTAQ